MGVLSSAALALAPMGPPVATLPQGQYAGGVGYAFSEMTLEVTGPVSKVGGDAELDDFRSSVYYIYAGYGLSDTWSVYGAIGVADAEFDADTGGSDFDGDTDTGFAIGTKKTLQDDGGKIKWGTVLQYCRGKSEDKINSPVGGQSFGNQSISLGSGYQKIELDWYEIQLGLGPAVQVRDNLCVYGGPFLDFFQGDLELSTEGDEYELQQRAELGAYIGGIYNVTSNISLSAELLVTGEAWGLGVSANMPF